MNITKSLGELIKFSFLIGKVLTVIRISGMIKDPDLFPFLIGKVLTI